ncbi:MAG TPA: DUF5123 domain-containing protein [Fermentimonas sp.]|nr:DUF5123 domain-containing protein [Fermentimonas sp.]
MKNKIKISLLGLLMLSLVGLFSGCDDDDNLGTADRLFRPIIKKSSYSGTWIRLEWDKYEGANLFNLQLSVDSFETVLRNVETDTTFYLFEDLDYDTSYQLRIRSLGNEISSDYFVNENIKTSDYPTRLMTPSAEDVIDNRARIKWNEDVYDSLVISRNDTLVATIVLTEEQNTDGEVVISSLAPETSYIVRAYTGGEYMGKKSFSTVASQVFEGNVVDLRERDEEESFDILSQEFIDDLSIQYPDGFTIVLSGGTTYGLNSILQLSTSVKFITGLSLKGFAVMAVANNFDLVANAEVDALQFEKIIFTDHPDKPRNADGNFGGTYIFNFGNGGAVVGELSFENCDIRYKRGVVRMKASATIDKFIINNCFVDSIAGYGVLNFDHAESFGGDIIISNSTISHTQRFISARKTPSINSVTLENITACFMPNGSGDYILDLEDKEVPGGILIKNSIFGPAWGGTSRGFRAAAGVTVTVDKSYRTSDQKWSVDAETNAPLNPIDLEDFGKTSDEVFANPSANDYSVTDPSLVSRIGDPRWW